MIRLFIKESKTIVGAATIVGVLSFVSRIVGLVRDRILAGTFGAGDALDVYYAAFKVPDFLFSLIVVGALSASFIPIFIKYNEGGISQKKAWQFTNNILHVLGFAMIITALFIFIFANPLASVIAPGFIASKQASVALFMRVMIIAQVLLTASMVFGSVLQSLRRFFLYSLAPIFYNIGIIIGALVFVDWMGPIGLAWGVVFGAFLHLVVQVVGARKLGYSYSFRFSLKDRDTKELLRLTGPRLLGIATSQILFLVLAVLASTLVVGSLTVFQFAYNIQFFAVGVIGVSYAIAVFPSLSRFAKDDDMQRFVSTLSSTIRQMLYLLLPMSVLFLVMRAQIVRVVVGAGEFDWSATIATADTLAFFAITFIPQALVFVLARGYFALHDTITPLMAALVGALVGIISAFLFIENFGVIGLGMAYSLASLVNALLLWIPLRQRLGTLDESRITQSLMKMLAATFVCAVIMQFLKPVVVSVLKLDTFVGVFLQGFIAGGIGIAAYIVVLHLLKSREQVLFLSAIKRRLLKKAAPGETLSTGAGQN